MAESFDQSSVQHMNRCTGPAPCQCPITGPHQPTNPYCSRNREDKVSYPCGPKCSFPECTCGVDASVSPSAGEPSR